MPRKRNGKKSKKGFYQKGRKSKNGLNKTEQKQVKTMVKNMVLQNEEWAMFDPPMDWKMFLNSSGNAQFTPSVNLNESTFSGSTALRYYNNYGIIVESNLATALGVDGIDSREGRSITIRRILLRILCNANINKKKRTQQFKVHLIKMAPDAFAGLDSGGTSSQILEYQNFLSNLMKSIPAPGRISSDLSEETRAFRKLYKVHKTWTRNCRLSSGGDALVGLEDATSLMYNCKIPVRYPKTDQASNELSEDTRLFFIIKWGGVEEFFQPDVDLAPEFHIKANIWYTT